MNTSFKKLVEDLQNLTLAKGDSESFTVTVEFVDDDKVNNAAQSQALNFDIVVHAVQSLRVIATSD